MSVQNTHFGADEIGRLLKKAKKIFFIGIGGINMSSLAHMTLSMGYAVGGSDRTRSSACERLEERGAAVSYSHAAENAEGYDAFIYTVAISEDNPEYVYAKNKGLPLISRSDYLGYVMTRYKKRLGVAGMHGKSTCTSMCAETLISSGADPTVLSGAELAVMGGAYRLGNGDDFVFEACEYMDSFLDFNPTVAVILNIEMDHVDYFKSMEQIRASFAKYADLTGAEGCAVYNADDAEVVRALEGYEGRRVGFGINNKSATVRAENISCRGGRYGFDIILSGNHLCRVELRVSGYYNIYNALAAAAACYECGVSAEDIAKGLGGFCGACRRMEYKGSVNSADVYDDYGHHPTEIKATLGGAKDICEGRLFCVYQPHTYSRTYALLDEFTGAFEACDRVIFVDIYAAREINTFGVSSEGLAGRVGERASYAGSFSEAADILSRELSEGDVAVVMGAGDVWRVFDCLELKD